MIQVLRYIMMLKCSSFLSAEIRNFASEVCQQNFQEPVD